MAHWYWREGYSYYKQNNYIKAIELFENVKPDNSYPEDHLLTLYFLAVSYQEEDRMGDAEVIYRDLLTRYPDSDYAEQAKWNLDQLKWNKDTKGL